MNFLNNDDWENKSIFINPKNEISEELKEFLSTIPATESDRFLILGNQFFNQKDYKKALLNFNKSLELDENHIQTLYSRAATLLELDRINEAYSDLEKITDENPLEFEAFFQKALINIDKNTFNSLSKSISELETIYFSEDHFLRNLKKIDEIQQFPILLSILNNKIGNYNESKVLWEKAKKLNSNIGDIEDFL